MAEITTETLTASIKEILKDADLSALSSKKVRSSLQEKFSTDLIDRKKEIDDILMELLTASQSQSDGDEKTVKNGASKPESEDSDDDDDIDTPPPKKKSKPSKPTKTLKPAKKPAKQTPSKAVASHDPHLNDLGSDSGEETLRNKINDEQLARQLQTEENNLRSSRHRSTKKSPTKRKKSRKTIEKTGEKKASSSGYHKPCLLSPQLANIMGTDQMPRSEVVKKMWQIANDRNLKDPKNRQFMVCDDELYTVFGRRRVRLFGMMKHLTEHMTNS